jgi:hypothetical protein
MRVSAIQIVLRGALASGLFLGCSPAEMGKPAVTGSGGSAGAPTPGTGGSPAAGGSGGSGYGSGGSGPAAGGTSGGGSGGTPAVAVDAGTGATGGGDAGATVVDPGPAGSFPGCPKCKQIFDGKTLDGWFQSPAGSFVVNEAGAIASTGKGAHAWTKEDYGDYRILFSVRQIKGNHKPCTTLFCTRPPNNGNATRGLSGIQFQPPLGGSWDYRPGKNSGPNTTNWMYPMPRPTFDVTKWHRCEVLARASTGEIHGACCQIEGMPSCKGQDVMRYKDATAGKKGPFALMMHNAGLFDEYKDIWVETDPVGDDLVTQK